MYKLFLILFLSLFSISVSYALQIKSAKDNQTIFAKISAKELSRIFILNDRIQNTRGINGAYELTKDEKQGSIFIRPTPFYQTKAFNLFITTEQGHTYNLFLTPLNIPAESIEIKSLSPSVALAEHWEKNSPYTEILIQLMHAMTNGVKPEGYAVIDMGKLKPKKLDKGITMQLITLYRGSHLQGEIWLIKNSGSETRYFKPRDFFNDTTRAISLEDEMLNCNDETYLYRIVDHD